MLECKILNLTVSGVCFICSLPLGPAHVTSDNRDAKRGVNCDCWARDALLEVAWYTFYDHAAISKATCPATHLQGQPAFFSNLVVPA